MSNTSVKIRDSARNAIKRYLQASQTNPTALDIESIESFMQLLQEQWIRFNKAQEEVEVACGSESIPIEEEARVQAESWYIDALANFNRLLRLRAHPTSNRDTVHVAAAIHLPKMELPSFSGDPINWISFHDAFTSLVDKQKNLSDGQKLHYLQNCLKGEALQVISNFKVCDANYIEAWNLLKSRYKVMRVIVEHHLLAIFSINKVSNDSANSIKLILDTILQHTRALKALHRPTEFWDDWLVHIVVSKLAFETRKQWELSLVDDDLPTFEQLQTFLETRCRSLEMLTLISAAPHTNKPPYKKPQKYLTNVLHAVENQDFPKSSHVAEKLDSCWFCNANHKIYVCANYNNLDPVARVRAIKQKGTCLNCLSKGHQQTNCRSLSTCRVCRRHHHTSLHSAFATPYAVTSAFSSASQSASPSAARSASPIKTNIDVPAAHSMDITAFSTAAGSAAAASDNVISHYVATERSILLATAIINIRDCAGRWQPARVLFDHGSHASFITESCVQRLGLARKPSSIFVTGIGSSQGGRSKGETSLIVSSRLSERYFTMNALILNKITNDLPTAAVKVSSWPHIEKLPLADPNFSKPSHIDILIGMDEMEQFLTPEFRKGDPGTPMAQETVFGWVLFGRAGDLKYPNRSVQTLHCDVQLVKALSRLWEEEELPQKKYLKPEESFCEEHFAATHRRSPNGRFIVQLPLKKDVPLGESRTVAVRSFIRMEKRFSTNDDLRLRYSAFMKELIDMGHMEQVFDLPCDCFYMPHHPVLKETSSTTKLRVVFNASVKTSTGYSLNDALMVGPQLQQDLFAILLRFRANRYAMTADVEKMYRQVMVSENCTDYQRIVWRQNPAEPLQDYRMLRVTYGVASASHLAVKSLQQTAIVANKCFEAAATIILRDFYMDDLLTGCSSEETLIKLQKDIAHVLSTGGFELRKWATNSKLLTASFPDASKQVSHFLADDQEVRALGLVWNTEHDFLTFSVSLKKPPLFLSKRAFLSDASKVFDPLGLVAPCTIRSKIWFQQIWREDVDWDEPVPLGIEKQWLAHRKDLSLLSSLKLKRWLGTGHSAASTELHVFSDASECAYAAVIYARTLHSDGSVTIALVAARTKVAPLKSTTLPRLELCAAHLAAKLAKQTISSLEGASYKLYAWTDSTVTLAWLQGHPSRWSTYVANRVADTQEVLPPECWAHVRSECNPADCASRGVSPADLLQNQLWWQGPPWLKETNNICKNRLSVQHTTELELRSRHMVVHLAQPVAYWELLLKFASYTKLKRITAYALRFIKNSRRIQLKKSGPITSQEVYEAELALIKYSQNYSFSNEISLCSANKEIPLRSSLSRLQPFLDENGVLRVGGRIKKVQILPDAKNPIVLPKNSPLAKLIIADIHKFALHAGPQIMQTILHRRFWVISSRNLVRKIYRNCVKCKRLNRMPLQQSMADLPCSRTTYTRCFLRSAVDFAGPYCYKFAAGRGTKSVKGYICSFICMSTGAMHLEFVGDLSSAAFINAFKRFINRRGYCRDLYSDNGTNFVAADKELRAMLHQCMSDDSVRAYFVDSFINWHFNPPSAPHMGGYWEIGIKRIKYHLKRTIGDVLLTFEEFTTLLSEVEACVNSRPLCSNATNVDDLNVLTPGHFILGEPLKSLPEPEMQDFKGTLYQRWQVISSMRQHFWRRWHDEYLVSLQKRAKWVRPSPNIKENDIVIVVDHRTPSSKWKLAKVLKCHPGTDQRVRVASLKTADGNCLRPIAKLCLLPTKHDIFENNL